MAELKPCGTPAAYRRALRLKKKLLEQGDIAGAAAAEPCGACKQAHSDSIAPWRGQRTPPPPRELRGCGSEAAYQRAIRRQAMLREIGDLAGAFRAQPCDRCRRAHAKYVNKYLKASRARKRAA